MYQRLFQIQLSGHKIVGQKIGGYRRNYGEKQSEEIAEPEIGRGGYADSGCIGKEKIISVCGRSGEGGKNGTDQVGYHGNSHINAYRSQNLVAVKAVSDGDAHINYQDASYGVYDKEHHVKRNACGCGNAEYLLKAFKQDGQAFRNSLKDFLVYDHHKDGKDDERSVDQRPYKGDERLTPDKLGCRDGQGVHQISFVRKKIFTETDNRQIYAGDDGDGDKSDNVEKHKRHVQNSVPDTGGLRIEIFVSCRQGKLDIKASDDGNDDQGKVKRNHQPVDRLKFVFD